MVESLPKKKSIELNFSLSDISFFRHPFQISPHITLISFFANLKILASDVTNLDILFLRLPFKLSAENFGCANPA